MANIKLSSKNQIVVPATVRQKLKIKHGSALDMFPVNENVAIVLKLPKPGGYAESMVGLGKDIWDELGGAEKFIEEERNSWGDR